MTDEHQQILISALSMTKSRYTLQRLTVNLSVLCGVALAANAFPDETIALTLNSLLAVPFFAVATVAIWLSREKRPTLWFVTVGAFIGFLFAPALLVNRGRAPTFWEQFILDFETVSIWTAGGALSLAFLERLLQKP